MGANRIASRTDGTPNANKADEVYDELRLKALRLHTWNFSVGRVQLARSATDPVFGFDKKFAMPSDNLKVVRVYDNDRGIGTIPYRIEKKFIHADSEQVFLKYIQDVSDPNLMDPSFRSYFSFLIAETIALGVTNSNKIKEEMIKDRKSALREAKSIDAIEDFPDEQQNGSWLDERNR